jgi:hypothetical protein
LASNRWVIKPDGRDKANRSDADARADQFQTGVWAANSHRPVAPVGIGSASIGGGVLAFRASHLLECTPSDDIPKPVKSDSLKGNRQPPSDALRDLIRRPSG